MKKIFILHSPWPEWRAVGHYVVAESTPLDEVITASDSIGREILSFVPQGDVRAFLDIPQYYVSFYDLFLRWLTTKNQIDKTFIKFRGRHVHRVRSNASLIFGPEFNQEWFLGGYDRGSNEMLQGLLGVKPSKGYPVIAPILFPNCDTSRMDEIFLNPALAKASPRSIPFLQFTNKV